MFNLSNLQKPTDVVLLCILTSPTLVVQGPVTMFMCRLPLHLTLGHGRPQDFFQGAKSGGLGDGSPPAGSRGRAPVGVWGRSPQKLTAYFKNCILKNRLLLSTSNSFITGAIIQRMPQA